MPVFVVPCVGVVGAGMGSVPSQSCWQEPGADV